MQGPLSLSEYLKERYQGVFPIVKESVAAHKPLFEKVEPYFMGINPQPAWKILDEGMNLLERVDEAIQHNNVTPALAKELYAWDNSPKPEVLSKFIYALQAVYPYAHAVNALEGRDLEPIFREAMPAGGNHMNELAAGTTYLNMLLNTTNGELRTHNKALYAELDKQTQKYNSPYR